jgi:hypothetical protein
MLKKNVTGWMIIVGLVYRFDRQDTQRYEYVYKGNLEQ